MQEVILLSRALLLPLKDVGNFCRKDFVLTPQIIFVGYHYSDDLSILPDVGLRSDSGEPWVKMPCSISWMEQVGRIDTSTLSDIEHPNESLHTHRNTQYLSWSHFSYFSKAWPRQCWFGSMDFDKRCDLGNPSCIWSKTSCWDGLREYNEELSVCW